MSTLLLEMKEWEDKFRQNEHYEIIVTAFCGDISLKKTLSKDRRCIQITIQQRISKRTHDVYYPIDIQLTRLQAMDLALTIQNYYNS